MRDAPGRGIELDRDDVDHHFARWGPATLPTSLRARAAATRRFPPALACTSWWICFEIEQEQRPQDARIAHRRRQLQQALMDAAIREAQVEMDRHGAAIGAFERGRQRIEQPREHERQRLELLDRPLEL